jgi:uncharacterized DUF497 family protein
MENLDVLNLLSKLNEKIIGKGELDVVYTEYQNWSRNGLLLDDVSHLKGKQTKLSIKEYMWLRVVDKLSKFGVDFNAIKAVKNKVFSVVEPDLLVNEITNEESGFAKEYPEEYKKTKEAIESDENLRNNVLKDLKLTFTSFELLLIAMIKTGNEVRILVSEMGDNEIEMEGVELDGKDLENVNQLKKSAHIVLPFSELTTKYLNYISLRKDASKYLPLSKDEHQLVKMVRGKDFIKILSVEVNYCDQDDDFIDVECLKKKSKVESRLLGHIQKGLYQKIKYKTKDNVEVSFDGTHT